MQSKTMKWIVKGALGLTISAVIGYTMKLEKKIEGHIDDYYETSTS